MLDWLDRNLVAVVLAAGVLLGGCAHAVGGWSAVTMIVVGVTWSAVQRQRGGTGANSVPTDSCA